MFSVNYYYNFFVKHDKRVKSIFLIYAIVKKIAKLGLHGGEYKKKKRVWYSAFGLWPQSFILFGFGQELSSRCIPSFSTRLTNARC